MSVNSAHLSPCLLLPSPSIPHELVLEYEIWVLCIFMIKADDILMGGTKNCIWSALVKGRFPSISGTYHFRSPFWEAGRDVFPLLVTKLWKSGITWFCSSLQSSLENWLTLTNWRHLYKAHIPYPYDKTLLVNTAIQSFMIELIFHPWNHAITWIRRNSMD